MDIAAQASTTSSPISRVLAVGRGRRRQNYSPLLGGVLPRRPCRRGGARQDKARSLIADAIKKAWPAEDEIEASSVRVMRAGSADSKHRKECPGRVWCEMSMSRMPLSMATDLAW